MFNKHYVYSIYRRTYYLSNLLCFGGRKNRDIPRAASSLLCTGLLSKSPLPCCIQHLAPVCCPTPGDAKGCRHAEEAAAVICLRRLCSSPPPSIAPPERERTPRASRHSGGTGAVPEGERPRHSGSLTGSSEGLSPPLLLPTSSTSICPQAPREALAEARSGVWPRPRRGVGSGRALQRALGRCPCSAARLPLSPGWACLPPTPRAARAGPARSPVPLSSRPAADASSRSSSSSGRRPGNSLTAAGASGARTGSGSAGPGGGSGAGPARSVPVRSGGGLGAARRAGGCVPASQEEASPDATR
ncbi:unnamed protein product [Lepidochelys kempii]